MRCTGVFVAFTIFDAFEILVLLGVVVVAVAAGALVLVVLCTRVPLTLVKLFTHRAHPRGEYRHFEHPIERVVMARVVAVVVVWIDRFVRFEFLPYFVHFYAIYLF